MVDPKFIEEVTVQEVGEEAVPFVHYLNGKTDVSEFKISEALKCEIHETRTILYKLYEKNLATFVRRKDKQKGWYVCYWDFHPEKIVHLYKKMKEHKLEELQQRYNKEQNNDYFICPRACIRMDFDKAVQNDYKCPECGGILNPMDNSRTIEFLQEKIKEIKKEITAL